MALFLTSKTSVSLCSEIFHSLKLLRSARHLSRPQCSRSLKTSSTNAKKVPSFAFAFDIDGVLLRSSTPLPHASKTLSYLQSHRIPFILLTNGGGKHESERVSDLSRLLGVSLDTSMFVQSHTPFAELVDSATSEEDSTPLKDKTILVVGGDGDKCRRVAESYGFTSVVTPADIITSNPTLWPFCDPLVYKPHAHPLPKPIYSPDSPLPPTSHLRISAIFVFNDPRDWALDTQLLLDLLLSSKGILGTLSAHNNNPNLPNRGYQTDAQPTLYFSNPDLFWASSHHLPRLGQGGFREAFEGVWDAVTGGGAGGVVLRKEMFGKPYRGTYEFAEKRLEAHRLALLNPSSPIPPTKQPTGKTAGLDRVYMIGDNPASDIQGANDFVSPSGRRWRSILVRTGVFSGEGEPDVAPDVVVDDVGKAVEWALGEEGWEGKGKGVE